MSSVDARIQREAKLYRQEIEAAEKRRLTRLRELLLDEVHNMRSRAIANGADRDDIATWLHGKSFDATYHDFAAGSKQFRTRRRIQALVALCGGDEKLFLKEYTRVLDAHFPVSSPSFSWKPRLVRPDEKRLTVVHSWKRVPIEE